MAQPRSLAGAGTRKSWNLPQQWRLVPVLLIGAALRLFGIYKVSPPGLEHDEVANWLIDRGILAGQHAIYFTEAYGHEAGFHYVQAGSIALLGDNALALRLPAAFMGLLGIAVAYILVRQLFGSRVALLSAALLAVLFYPVFYSRLGLRAIMLPLLSALSAYFWWRGWNENDRIAASKTGQWKWVRRLAYVRSPSPSAALPAVQATAYVALAGFFAGLSLHTYMAARVVPIFYALFMVGLAVTTPKALRARWQSVALFWFILLLVASPLLIFLLTNPGAEFRISEIDAPLRALRQGNLRLVVDNAVDILGAFGFRGDPLWRQNVAAMPIFDPLIALLFYACLGLSLLYVRDARYLFVILWLFTATIPSIVTIDAPSSIRMINILPVLTVLPAILMHNLGRLSTESMRLSTTPVDKWVVRVLIFGVILLHVVRTVQATFLTWPANHEVQFVWQDALTDAAGFLDRSSHVQDVAIAGWTPESMDAPTMEVTLRREDLKLRFFDPRQSLLVPASGTGAPSLILRPTILPLDPSLQNPLQRSGAISETSGSFVTYRLAAAGSLAPDIVDETVFGNELVLQGYSWHGNCRAQEASVCTIVTYWRVLQAPPDTRRIFLHVIGEEGDVLGTGDALGAPAAYWRSGDVLLQKHEVAVELLEAGETMRLGVYNPRTERRLLTAAGDEYVQLLPGRTE